MKNKKMYNPKDIYFGCLTYNAKPQGYYHSGPLAFEKVVASDGEELYRELKSRKANVCREFYEGIKDYVSVQFLIQLTELMPKEKHGTLVSKKLINYYLLKYLVEFKKYDQSITNIEDYCKDKQKSLN